MYTCTYSVTSLAASRCCDLNGPSRCRAQRTTAATPYMWYQLSAQQVSPARVVCDAHSYTGGGIGCPSTGKSISMWRRRARHVVHSSPSGTGNSSYRKTDDHILCWVTVRPTLVFLKLSLSFSDRGCECSLVPFGVLLIQLGDIRTSIGTTDPSSMLKLPRRNTFRCTVP